MYLKYGKAVFCCTVSVMHAGESKNTGMPVAKSASIPVPASSSAPVLWYEFPGGSSPVTSFDEIQAASSTAILAHLSRTPLSPVRFPSGTAR